MSLISFGGRKVGVIGLGYVGLPLAAEIGKSRDVLGFDINKSRVNQLRSGFDRTLECSSEQLAAAKHLQFTADESELDACSIFIVTVPTPVDEANRPDLSALVQASTTVGSHLKPGDVVIYESTVFPGATEEISVPVLESASGLSFNVDFFCGYSPERVNPGDKVHALPTIIKIVSGSTPAIAAAIEAFYAEFIAAGTWLAPNMKVAEAAKVIENAQRDLNIAFVNECSIIFERLGIDTIEVLEAAGTKWNFLPFRPGMVGGHCIGVDPYYLTHKAERIGYNPQIILAGRRLNDNMPYYGARFIVKKMARRGIDVSQATVGILGVTFKDNCPDVRNSKVFDMVREFESWGVKVLASDPWADASEVLAEYGVKLVKHLAPNSCDALVVAVAHDQYREIELEVLMALCRDRARAVLGDLKAIYNRDACIETGFDVFRF